eukprot:CAMPEP_0184856228 /NCGR_PEP_ID=MMETSP0580-20130426/1402_1 /TAXON_ID=1118495 /ORGANISM="Dactyliosolen fragilissimus" /LENGTH=191 /DNA_ID=CAMNT_0027351113 /DNA_START=46 /DNA_END=617 /DNA_ORIENTATION=+
MTERISAVDNEIPTKPKPKNQEHARLPQPFNFPNNRASKLMEKLNAFLPEMDAANKELLKNSNDDDKIYITPILEKDERLDSDSDSDSCDSDNSVNTNHNESPKVEMTIGLGVDVESNPLLSMLASNDDGDDQSMELNLPNEDIESFDNDMIGLKEAHVTKYIGLKDDKTLKVEKNTSNSPRKTESKKTKL